MLLEMATQVYSGSVYGDFSLYNNSGHPFLGEFNTTNVSVVKTHYPVGPTHGPEFAYPAARRAVILLRDPRNAIPSYLNYIFGDSIGAKHSVQAPAEAWEEWRDASLEAELLKWKSIITNWTERLETAEHLHITLYEDLTGSRASGVEALRSLIQFLDWDGGSITADDISCVWEQILGRNAHGNGIRRSKNYVPAYTAAQHSMIKFQLEVFLEYIGNNVDHYSPLAVAIRRYAAKMIPANDVDQGAAKMIPANDVDQGAVVDDRKAPTGRQRLVEWWQSHPSAPLGISCDPTAELLAEPYATSMGLTAPPPLFRGRSPDKMSATTGDDRIQVAMVIPFVRFQIPKLVYLLSKFWSEHPPCLPDTPVQSVDLVFFTESEVSWDAKDTIMRHITELGRVDNATRCFHNAKSPRFVSLTDVDPELSHLEGAASAFYSLFGLLESHYRTFLLAEPDVVPVQGGFVPVLFEQSRRMGCGEEELWQSGSPPLVADVEAGMLRERVDYHLNGNALYALGCEGFEDYKCRVQTFYVPKDECSRVAGCGTHEAYEGGYDHALYRFRMHPDNYEYSRLVLNRFAHSQFVQNRGEAIYDPEEVVRDSRSTYFVHSKSIYMHPPAIILKEAVVSTLRRDVCQDGDNKHAKQELAVVYRKLREGGYDKDDAIRHLCRVSKNGVFGDARAIASVCEGAKMSKSKKLQGSEKSTFAYDINKSLEVCVDGWDSIIPTFRDGDTLLRNKEGSNRTNASIGASEVAAEREIPPWPPANCEIPSAHSSISEVDGIDGDHRNSICPNGTTHSFDCHISVCEAHLIPPQVERYSQTNLHEP